MIITEFNSRRTPKGQLKEYTWGEFKERLKDVVVTEETINQYHNEFTDAQKTDAKDVGGFIGGKCTDGIRGNDYVESRTVITIDADKALPDDVEAFKLCSDYQFFVYTTHTSTTENPRLRWVLPLSRPVTPEEYKVVATKVSRLVGEDIDDVTSVPAQLMFYPSVALDGDFQTWEGGSVPVDPDDFIELDDVVEEAPVEVKPEKEQKSADELQNIEEGNRNKNLFGYACTLRSVGLDDDGLRFAVTDYNDRYNKPPLDPAEVDTVVRSVCKRYAPGDRVQDTMRDSYDDFCDMGVMVKPEKKPDEKHIALESANSIGLRDIEPPKFFVDGLLTTGITILASPPKFGKSWLCTDLCQRVANGERFLGLKTTKTKVIYLALEDGAYRLKDRGLKVSGGKPLPTDLFLTMEAPGLNEGLIHELTLQVEKLGGDVGCIVIDTLQKVRGEAHKTEGVYGYDYRELGGLHQFAIENNIAVVLVHHLNKGGNDNDFVTRLNGSMGISGAADTIITMTRAARGDKQTKMCITGRDVKEQTLILQMNWSTYRWENLGDEESVQAIQEDAEYENDPIVKTIRYNLDEAEDLMEDNIEEDTVSWSCTSQGLVDAIVSLYGEGAVDGGPTRVGQEVRKLEDKLKLIDGISYEYIVDGNKREHRFTRYIV